MTNVAACQCAAAPATGLVEETIRNLIGIDIMTATPEQFAAAVRQSFLVREEAGVTIVESIRSSASGVTVPLAALPYSQQKMIGACDRSFDRVRALIKVVRPRDCCTDPGGWTALLAEFDKALTGVARALTQPLPAEKVVVERFDLVDDLRSRLVSQINGTVKPIPQDRLAADVADLEGELRKARSAWTEWQSLGNDPEKNLAQLTQRLGEVAAAAASLIADLDRHTPRRVWGLMEFVKPAKTTAPRSSEARDRAEPLLLSIVAQANEAKALAVALSRPELTEKQKDGFAASRDLLEHPPAHELWTKTVADLLRSLRASVTALTA